jgi:hypothetical protein
MKSYGFALFALLIAGCSSAGTAPGTRSISATIAIFPGHGPSTAPPSGQPRVASTSLVFTNSNASAGSAFPQSAAQYLISEPNYNGTFSITNSCGTNSVASASFENGIVLGNPAGSYSFASGATGTGPAALLDVSANGAYSNASCSLDVADSSGHTATIALTNRELLLYAGQQGPTPEAGAIGQPGVTLPNFAPATYLVFEQGYSGAYSLEPSTCQEFHATLSAGASPMSGAQLSLSYGPSKAMQTCTFVIDDVQGQSVSIEAYEET